MMDPRDLITKMQTSAVEAVFTEFAAEVAQVMPPAPAVQHSADIIPLASAKARKGESS